MASTRYETIYRYKGRDKYARKRKGVLYAFSDIEAKTQLQSQGISLNRLQKPAFQWFARKRRPKSKDLLYFTVQMATTLSAGLPVDNALRLAANHSSNLTLRKTIREILTDIESGHTLESAFASHPRYFDGFYTSLLGVGESTGNLAHMMQRLAEALEKITAIKEKIKKALSYPLTVLSIGLLVVAGLLIFVIPQFEDMFLSFGATLPAFTVAVVSASEFLQTYFWYLICLIIGALLLFRRLLHQRPTVRYWRDSTLLALPLFGKMQYHAMIARFARTLSTLYEGGTPMTDALNQTSQAMNNLVYKRIVNEIHTAISEGERLADAMRATGGFNELAISMVAIGEETGQLQVMLDRIAEAYEKQLDRSVDLLTTMIEPVLILFLGAMVCIVLMAIYLPIFSLGGAL